jgi:hypothetical protein
MSQPLTPLVVPAKAGTQSLPWRKQGSGHTYSGSLDPRFRGGDEQNITE